MFGLLRRARSAVHRLALAVSAVPDALLRWAPVHRSIARLLWEPMGLLGRLRARIWKDRYFADAVAELLPELDARHRREVAGFLGSAHERLKLLRAWALSHGPATMAVLCRPGGTAVLFDRLRRREPTVLLAWHVGVWLGATSALARSGLPVLAVLGGRLFPGVAPVLGRIEMLTVSDPSRRFSTLRECVNRLRAGGIVGMAPDGPVSENPLEIPFLGRTHRIGRGAALLARLTGAAVFPISGLWNDRGTGWRLVIGDRLDTPSLRNLEGKMFDHALLSAASVYFEAVIRRDPRQLRTDHLEYLTSLPRRPLQQESTRLSATSRPVAGILTPSDDD